MKVHITLKKEARTPETVGHVVRTCGLREVNEPRAARWGVITAEIAPEDVNKIKLLPEVQAVEPDSEKHIA